MPLVNSGNKDKPFIITRDSAYGDWQVCYPAPDKADSFLQSQREHDPYAVKYYGADFDGGSMPYIYDKVLCDRMRTEFTEYSGDISFSDADKNRLRALINFFEDNINSLSSEVTDYLAGIEQPFRALARIYPHDLSIGHEGWAVTEKLVADAIDTIEEVVANTVSLQNNRRGEMPSDMKINTHDSAHTISYIELLGYEIELGEDTNHEKPYYVETNYRPGGDFSLRTDNYSDACVC